MDPISAFALAGTVVTFVDFSSKLISGAKELYKTTSGALSANQELELVASDLRSVLAKIHDANKVSPRTADGSNSLSDPAFEESFAEMCESAKTIADELLGRLEPLKVGKDVKGARRVWESVSQAVNSAWSRNELAAMASKLKTLKELLEFRVLFQVRDHLSLLTMKVSEGFRKLDRQTEFIVSALAQSSKMESESGAGDQVKVLTQLLARVETNNSHEHRKTREMIAAVAGSPEIICSLDLLEIPYKKESKIRREVSNGILDELNFETRTHRFQELTAAHKKTFEWAFDKPIDGQKWASFSEWLSQGEGVYWIQGKAGAGKSTLMGFIHENHRTRQYLNNWASESLPLYIGSFFFWLSGTREQKSQQGLLRSLLFEILNQEPTLVPVVFPHLWAERYNRCVSGSLGLNFKGWSLGALKDAFELLVHQNIVPMKLCLFIDGLDEFDGDPEEISELFKQITSQNVKICLSSRPWVVFEECFKGRPSLRLQDLTRHDIKLYVDDLLSGSPLFRQQALLHPTETQEFVQEIVEKADGVFLWVAIVVKSLLRGIRNRDSIQDIQLRLRSLPKELEPLYGHILNLIEPEYLPWASKAFQILITKQQHVFSRFSSDALKSMKLEEKPLSLLDLTLAIDEANVAHIKNYKIHPKPLTALQNKCDDTRIHLTARCAGLLETWDHGSLSHNSPVQFLHRTARDYLLKPAVWGRFLAITPPSSFNPNVSLLRSCVLQIIISPSLSHTRERKESEALSFAFAAESSQLKSPPELLDDLYSVISASNPEHLNHQWLAKLNTYHNLPHFESMLSIAAIFGLASYLGSKPIAARKNLIGDGASLLHYAIPRELTESRYIIPPTAKTVQVLLETCDVNLVYNSKSPWQQALAWVSRQHMRGNQWTERAECVKMLSLMLQAGANPRLNISEGYMYDIQSLVRDLKLGTNNQAEMDEELLANVAELDEEVKKACGCFGEVHLPPPPVVPVIRKEEAEFSFKKVPPPPHIVPVVQKEEAKPSKSRRWKAWLKK